MAGLVGNLTVRPEDGRGPARRLLTATDLADYLVTRGVPFRTAHEQVGNTVRLAEVQGRELWELSLTEIRQLRPGPSPTCLTGSALKTPSTAAAPRAAPPRNGCARPWNGPKRK